MKSLLAKIAVVAFLGLAGFAYSNKGGVARDLKISRTVANDGTFVTLEWNSSPDMGYAVQTSINLKDWAMVEENLSDPAAPGTFIYPIPDEYVFDSRRFFRVLSTPK
jgi:hypothetical protein